MILLSRLSVDCHIGLSVFTYIIKSNGWLWARLKSIMLIDDTSSRCCVSFREHHIYLKSDLKYRLSLVFKKAKTKPTFWLHSCTRLNYIGIAISNVVSAKGLAMWLAYENFPFAEVPYLSDFITAFINLFIYQSWAKIFCIFVFMHMFVCLCACLYKA